jgi:hypothetical protein
MYGRTLHPLGVSGFVPLTRAQPVCACNPPGAELEGARECCKRLVYNVEPVDMSA